MEASFLITDQDVEKGEPVALVSPSNPAQSETLYLSNIDQTVAFPVETVFFYEASGQNTLDIFERVRGAVSEVLLNGYYFMAGRLRFDPIAKRLELVCSNAGVVFVSAAARLRLAELGDVSVPNPSFKHLILRTDTYVGLENTPILTVQVTRFACGGFSIGFVTNHSILDGRSAAEMFENLASACRGEGMKKGSHPLNNDRTCIRARNPPQIKYEHEEYIKLADLVTSSSASSSFTSPDQPLPPASLLQLSDTHSYKVFSFTPAMIQSLKEKAMMTLRCSTFEAIVAHVWRARTRAVFDDPRDTSSVLFAVDVRSKLSPPLPDGFIGNAVITARASAKVGEMEGEPLSFFVEKVKKAIDRVTDDYLRSVVDWLEVHKGVPSTAGGNFYVSAWWKLPFHELDFGYGRPVYGGPVVSGMDEFVLLLADGSNGGIRVWMVLKEEKMQRFEAQVFSM